MKYSREGEAELGRQVRTLRLKQDLDQQQMAAQAGIALNAVKRLESGTGTQLRTLVQVLRVLNKLDWLRTLAPEVSVSPLQMLKLKSPRQRASRKMKSGEPPTSHV